MFVWLGDFKRTITTQGDSQVEILKTTSSGYLAGNQDCFS